MGLLTSTMKCFDLNSLAKLNLAFNVLPTVENAINKG